MTVKRSIKASDISKSESNSKPKIETKAQQYDKLITKLGLDETYTKARVKPKFDNVKDNIPPLQDYNFQADLIMLPKTKKGFKYLLVIVDLWSDEIDVEPLETKEPDVVLKAMEKIFKSGKYLKTPYASIRTDAGTEFKGSFKKWLYNNNILHSVALPNRKKQMGNVESANKLLVRYLNGYMNMKEEELGKQYNEWTDILPELIKQLNKIRVRPNENPFTYKQPIAIQKEPKYKLGDVVIRKLDAPKNALNNEQDGKFRAGDLRWDKSQPRKIVRVLLYPKNVRYVLEGIPNVAYTEDELMEAPGEKESKFAVRKLIDKKGVGKTIYYKVWFMKELKKQAQWITKKQLLEDGLEDYIEEYENNLKK